MNPSTKIMRVLLWLVNILSLLSRDLQRIVYDRAGIGKTPMSFVVSPGSTWLVYTITNKTAVQAHIPSDLQLCPIRIFPGYLESYSLFFNFFHVTTELFQGYRLEIVTVVEERRTRKKRFIILDYLSNTISSDPIHLFKRPNANRMISQQYPNGTIECFTEGFHMHANIGRREWRLTHEFAHDANEKIYYGSTESNPPNNLSFHIDDVRRVHPIKDIHVTNDLWRSVRKENPSCGFYYDHSLHFTITPEHNETTPQTELYPNYQYLVLYE